MLHAIMLCHGSHIFIYERCPIIYDNLVRYAKTTYNALPYEIGYCDACCLLERDGLHPLDKIFCCHQNPNISPTCWVNGANEVKPPKCGMAMGWPCSVKWWDVNELC